MPCLDNRLILIFLRFYCNTPSGLTAHEIIKMKICRIITFNASMFLHTRILDLNCVQPPLGIYYFQDCTWLNRYIIQCDPFASVTFENEKHSCQIGYKERSLEC